MAAPAAHMKPPCELPEPVAAKTPGYFELEVPVCAEGSRRCTTACNSRRNTTLIAAIR